MLLAEKVFRLSLGIIAGIFFADVLFGSLALKIVFLVCGLLFLVLLFLRPSFVSLFAGIIIGMVFFGFAVYRHSRAVLPVKEFSAQVLTVSQQLNVNRLTVKLAPPYKGNILVLASLDTQYEPGDVLTITGTLTPFKSAEFRYARKENLQAQVVFPTIIKQGNHFVLHTALYRITRAAEGILARFLPREEAAFLSGILLGDTREFSPELKTAMNQTGTRHVAALSGYNITVIAGIMVTLGLLFLSRRSAFVLAAIAILIFVIMTGAEASAVRALVMAIVFFIARFSERMVRVCYLVAFTAAAMLIWNPFLLLGDVGFQLSFTALIGILAFMPRLKALNRPWMEPLFTTITAQAAALPLLIYYFGSASAIALPANMLVLPVIPFAMLGGFIVIVLGTVAPFLAQIVAMFLHILAAYEIGVITFLATLGWGSGSFFHAFVFTLALGLFVSAFYLVPQRNKFPHHA